MHVPSRELDIKIEKQLQVVAKRPVMEDMCPDKQCNKGFELSVSSTSSKLRLNRVQQMHQLNIKVLIILNIY